MKTRNQLLSIKAEKQRQRYWADPARYRAKAKREYWSNPERARELSRARWRERRKAELFLAQLKFNEAMDKLTSRS